MMDNESEIEETFPRLFAYPPRDLYFIGVDGIQTRGRHPDQPKVSSFYTTSMPGHWQLVFTHPNTEGANQLNAKTQRLDYIVNTVPEFKKLKCHIFLLGPEDFYKTVALKESIGSEMSTSMLTYAVDDKFEAAKALGCYGLDRVDKPMIYPGVCLFAPSKECVFYHITRDQDNLIDESTGIGYPVTKRMMDSVLDILKKWQRIFRTFEAEVLQEDAEDLDKLNLITFDQWVSSKLKIEIEKHHSISSIESRQLPLWSRVLRTFLTLNRPAVNFLRF